MPAALTDQRRGLLAKVHMAKARLKLDDDAYRAVIAEHFDGRESARDLDDGELVTLIRLLNRCGATGVIPYDKRKDRGRPRNPKWTREGLLSRIEALLTDKAAAQGRPVNWDYALAILKRMYKVERLEWATPEQLKGVMVAIEKGGRRKRRKQ